MLRMDSRGKSSARIRNRADGEEVDIHRRRASPHAPVSVTGCPPQTRRRGLPAMATRIRVALPANPERDSSPLRMSSDHEAREASCGIARMAVAKWVASISIPMLR